MHCSRARPIVQSSLNVIGVSGVVSTAVGQPIESVRRLQQQAILWKAVEAEARALLTTLAGANALRRDQLALLGVHAYAIATQGPAFRRTKSSCRMSRRSDA